MKRRRDETAARERLERELADVRGAVGAARAQRNRFAGALAGASEGVIIVDADGVEAFRNGRAARFRDPRHGNAVAAKVIEELLERARGGEVAERELVLHGPPLEVLRISAVPVHDGDYPVGAVAFVRDVSEEHRIEQVRRDFVANVSHELKTPVGALRVLAETMAEADDPRELAGFTDGIVRETDRLARLVDQLLELTAIESRGVTEPAPVDLPGVLAEAVERVHPVAEEHGVILRVEERVSGWVAGDREQLVRALVHLLDNAVKFSEPAMAVEVAVEDAHGWTAVTVRDQGVGIPSRDLGRVFERFFRVDRARAQTTKGLGLGLSIVRHVARAHGGDVTVESVEGEGSTFTLVLPSGTGIPAS